jgi:hypothetical protein
MEVFAQLAAETRSMPYPSEDVTISKLKLKGWLQPGDALIAPVTSLHVNTQKVPFPADPYSDDGVMWRIWNYRHQVTHRQRNPFNLKVQLNDRLTIAEDADQLSESSRRFADRGDAPTRRSAHFIIVPQDSTSDASSKTVEDDLGAMFDLVRTRLNAAIAAL